MIMDGTDDFHDTFRTRPGYLMVPGARCDYKNQDSSVGGRRGNLKCLAID